MVEGWTARHRTASLDGKYIGKGSFHTSYLLIQCLVMASTGLVSERSRVQRLPRIHNLEAATLPYILCLGGRGNVCRYSLPEPRVH